MLTWNPGKLNTLATPLRIKNVVGLIILRCYVFRILVLTAIQVPIIFKYKIFSSMNQISIC